MKVVYHPSVQKDVNRILRRYDEVSNQLGDEFWEELNRYIHAAAANPLRFHRFTGDLHRANLKRFPYHFLYRVFSDRIRITAVRRHRRHPRSALQRR